MAENYDSLFIFTLKILSLNFLSITIYSRKNIEFPINYYYKH